MRNIYEVFQCISFILNSSRKKEVDLSYSYLWHLLYILNECGINEVRHISSFYYTVLNGRATICNHEIKKKSHLNE